MIHVHQRYNSRQVYDSSYPEIDHNVFKKCDWWELYMEANEAIPMNIPEPWGKEVDIHIFVNSNHAGDKVPHRSRSGFLMYVNTALVQWFSKKQSTWETSVFDAEFITMKQHIDALRDLRYKFRMMGIPISGHWCIYGDNMSVVNNTSRPESVLRKKSNSAIMQSVSQENP